MIYTIGHSTRSQDEVLDMLAEHNVRSLIDVRSYPSSRYCPQWNREEIVNGDRGYLTYEWLPELGGKRKALPIELSVCGAWRNASFRGYGDYMQTGDFARGLEILKLRGATENVAIMCAEAVWWKCHRSMISDALVAAGEPVRHIMAAGKPADLHKLRDFAVLKDGRVTYPASVELPE